MAPPLSLVVLLTVALGMVAASSASPPTKPASCRATQLETSLALQGAGGHLVGPLRLRNTGRPCTLRGRPRVALRGQGGSLIRVRLFAGTPHWRFVPPREPPPAWPEVRLRSRQSAIAWLALSNWCRRNGELVAFEFLLPRAAGKIVEKARIRVRCETPAVPVSISVAPFEPVPS